MVIGAESERTWGHGLGIRRVDDAFGTASVDSKFDVLTVILRDGVGGAAHEAGEEWSEGWNTGENDLCDGQLYSLPCFLWLQVQIGLCEWMRRWVGTYADIELDNSPQNQHGRVAGSGDGDDLHHAHDRTHSRQQTQQENAAERDFLLQVDVQFDEQRDWEEKDDDIKEDCHCGQTVESRVVGQAFAFSQWHPRLSNWRTLKDEDECSGHMGKDGSSHDDEDQILVTRVRTRFQDTQVSPAESDFESKNAYHVERATREVDLPVLQHLQCEKRW